MIATSTNTAVYGGLEYARGLNLPSGTIVGHRSWADPHNDHVHLHHQLGLFYLPSLTHGQETPTRNGFQREVCLELSDLSRRGTDIGALSAAATLNEAEVGITDEIDLWMVAHVYRVLG